MDKKELRQFLELAAKAAGIRGHFGLGGTTDSFWLEDKNGKSIGKQWNPHLDDGDSRRLEVALEIAVEIHAGFAWAFTLDERLSEVIGEPIGNDPYAATRLAVLRAAAAIGAAMP